MLLFGHNQAKFGQFCIFWGCGLPSSAAILLHSAAILRRPVPHVGFCLEKSIFWPQKLKTADFGRKPYVNISGFLRQFCGKCSKVKIHLRMVRIACFSVLSAHLRSCRPFHLNSDKFVCSCCLVKVWCCHTHPTTENNPNCVFRSEFLRICGRYVFFFVRLTAGKCETFATIVAFFFGTLEGVRVIHACGRNTWKHCVLLSRAKLLASV